MNNLLDGMKLSSRTHSYYTRHELQASASGGQWETMIKDSDLKPIDNE